MDANDSLRIRAVTIDAHGVLLLPDADAIRGVLQPFGCSPDDAVCRRAHYEMVHLLDSMVTPDWPIMNQRFAEALGVSAIDRSEAGSQLADEIYLGSSWVPAPGATAALARLVEGGFGAAVVSNTNHGEVAELLSRVAMCSVDGDHVRVAAIVDSHVIGVEKPEAEPFLLDLDAMGESPTTCVHVGDSLHSDVAGAMSVGMLAVHIDPLDLCHDVRHGHAASFQDFVEDFA